MAYDVIDIPEEAREDTEQLGSKPKFWVTLNGQRWLFKEVRPNTGEDWAEKAAAEVAVALGVTAARVELAQYGGRRGCISLNFVDTRRGEALVHGNEIMAGHVTGYDRAKIFRQSDHTLANVVSAVRAMFDQEPLIHRVLTRLASYLVLDALIGNTDRHHENWGFLVRSSMEGGNEVISVAPSYDHASSLGRELLDAKRSQILSHRQLGRYIERGRGGIFLDAAQPHGENPLRLVLQSSKDYPAYFRPALARVASLGAERLRMIVDQIPDTRASSCAKAFALEMMLCAQTSLNEIRE
ncbi:HipA domain-containing protein [Roseateles amylovorans]|uniref:HipA domain-containing protein n=1 Tax=Roseateles amylovorans TaxID=2978473 RepID=A0ABY6B3E7_9BURK|nr:HipA domain-containing protein [Roseateles amylovorans]UXH78499.1 HipA domain-containing protein [Roseateles amylovorans]